MVAEEQTELRLNHLHGIRDHVDDIKLWLSIAH